MKKINKLLSIVLCTVISASLLAGCKGTGNKDASSNSNETSTKKVDFKNPNEYSWWMPATIYDTYTNYSENPVVKYFNKKFNTTLKIQQPAAGTETNGLNTLLATGDYTDLIDVSYYTGSVNQLYSDGVIIDIAKYLDYMPNLKKWIDEVPMLRKNIYNDNKQILKLPQFNNDDVRDWGGLVYREDILKTMTGGNIKFPSGNSEPTTLEDWDYMLPLFKQYFQAAGFKDYAPLIIPATGYFVTNQLISGFGVGASYYIEDGKMKYGPMEDGFYNYVAKMKEWYQKGYIYKDFASRTNDLFYLPNTALTYGAAAGVWFGLEGQLGTRMSIPDKGLNVNVKAIPDPLDKAHGITSAPTNQADKKGEYYGGTVISSKCKDIERLLSSLDWFYSTEGSYFKMYGLDEKAAAESDLYKKYNLTGFKNDSKGKPIHPVSIKDSPASKVKDFAAFNCVKLVGVVDQWIPAVPSDQDKIGIEASAIWKKYDNDAKRIKLPAQLYRTSEEDAKYTKNQSAIDDYVNSVVLKFILNGTELNQTTWNQFKDQLVKNGVKDNISIMQASYDRYNKR